MKKPTWSFAVLVLAVAVFAACGIVKTQKMERGHDIKKAHVNSIVKGQTTDKEILKMFGPPTKVRDTDEGQEFYYEHTTSGGPQLNLVISVGGSSMTETLLVWFDNKGIVTDYAYKKT